ncbi:uncharacterized protein MELLADRAFT_92944 [Melampsora larici-populina 98AG31]|uniref:Reverse transcriptase domain-containing protein n=1 Tax=Melampsora larici-populina (strain 98AG31 / pathotype 3-4-7) TaxID=747676 RepID=F4S3B8_MELLP|nr:uncharacterized protein MELLADRAFT_92944 [Melampsora larici-populina 98AG31]EGG00869.1 hypothetical protein MELLADRAFT_92944 [Melampsora larici-populina 98AG31]
MPPDLFDSDYRNDVGMPPAAPLASGSRQARSYLQRSHSAARKSRSPIPLADRIGPRTSKSPKSFFRSTPRCLFWSSPNRVGRSRGCLNKQLPKPHQAKGKQQAFQACAEPPRRASPPRPGPKSKGKERCISNTPPPSSRYSSDNAEEDIVFFPVPGAKKPRLFAAPIAELVDPSASPLAKSIQRLVTIYKADINHYINQYNCSPNKPASWPSYLTKDLLEYQCIDLKKLWGEMESKPSSEIFFFNKKSKKKDVKGVTDPLSIQDLSEFSQVMEVLRHAYLAAFYFAALSIKSYFDHIAKLCCHQSRIHWTHVRNYEAEIHQAFLQRPSLAWGNFGAPELRVFEGQNLNSRSVDRPVSPEVPPQAIQSSSRLLLKRLRGVFLLIRLRKVMMWLLKISLAIIGMQMSVPSQPTTASTRMTYATSWDALAIMKEALLTNKPNSRKFVRNMETDELWDGFSGSVDFSLSAEPLPSAPPLNSDVYASRAIRCCPDIFKIFTPINVPRLSLLLKNHPNRPFVNSAILEEEASLVLTRDQEMDLGHYSPGFQSLLLGMKVLPLCLATNQVFGKVQTCTNMSYGHPSPNSLIERAHIQIKLNRFFQFPNSGNTGKSFGCASSPKLWCSFFSLILWIAFHEFGIKELNAYMDDLWGVGSAFDLVQFKGHIVPLNQAKFLELFDYINIPWAWGKQVWGTELDIIGHSINCDTLSISLPSDKRLALIDALQTFIIPSSQPLVAWQRITGWANWAVNMFPLGMWAIQSSWEKIARKSLCNALVPCNKAVTEDLTWLAGLLKAWSGRKILKNIFWNLQLADMTFIVDVCPTGIGLCCPKLNSAWSEKFPPPSRDNFRAELLAVVTAIDIASPSALPAVSVMLKQNLDVKVRHVAGNDNTIANDLSRNRISEVKVIRRSTTVAKQTPLSFFEREALNQFHISKHLEPSTILKYKSATRHFLKFCQDHTLEPVPLEFNLAHFVLVTCLDLSPGTANKYLTGIVFCLRDQFPFVVAACASQHVQLSVRGCQKLLSVPVVCTKPFTLLNVHLCAKTFLSSFNNQLFNTIIALGFSGLHRLAVKQPQLTPCLTTKPTSCISVPPSSALIGLMIQLVLSRLSSPILSTEIAGFVALPSGSCVPMAWSLSVLGS